MEPQRCAKHNVDFQHSQQIRDIAGLPSATLAQHQTSSDSTPDVRWAAGLAVHIPANTRHWDSVVLMLGQPRRRW